MIEIVLNTEKCIFKENFENFSLQIFFETYKKIWKNKSPKVIELIKHGEKYLAEKLREFVDCVILKSPLFKVGVQ